MGNSSGLFDKAEKKNTSINQCIFSIVFLSLLGIFFNGGWLYVTVASTFFLQLLVWRLMYQKSGILIKARAVKRLEDLRNILGDACYSREYTNLNMIPKKSNHDRTFIIRKIEENIFWNSKLYYYLYKAKCFYFVFIAMALLILFFVLYYNFKEGDNYQFIRSVFVLLLISNAYDIFSDFMGASRAYKEMDKLSDFIEINKSNSLAMLPYIYSRYDFEISIAPPISNKIYLDNYDKIKMLWSERLINTKYGDVNNVLLAIKSIANMIHAIDEKWAITGGANRFIQGSQINANDIDIITTEKGVAEIRKILLPNENNEIFRTELGNIRSVYFTCEILGFKIEVMGCPENYNGFIWVKNNFWDRYISEIIVDDIKVPCMSMLYEEKMNKLIGNFNAFY